MPADEAGQPAAAVLGAMHEPMRGHARGQPYVRAMALGPRAQQLLFITLMVLAMSFVMSLAMALANQPLDGHFFGRWLRNWLLSLVVAWPTAYAVVPTVRRIVARLAK